MNILVTGGTGLLGKEICRQLIEHENYSVRCLVRSENPLLSNKVTQVKGDILDVPSIISALKGIDIVIHSAAKVSFNKKNREQLFKTNIEGTANLVNACLEYDIKKFVHISSVAAIGKPNNVVDSKDEIIVDENHKWQDSPNNSIYGQSKYLAELEVWRAQAEGLNTVIINPSIILGEGDWNKSSTQLFKYVYQSNKFFTNGYINYIDVKDVAKSVLDLMNKDIISERFILNAGRISFEEFFRKIAKEFNKRPPSIKLHKSMIEVLWRLEWLRSVIFRTNPIITKETSLAARSNVYFDNSKIRRTIDIKFQNIDSTIERVSNYLLAKG